MNKRTAAMQTIVITDPVQLKELIREVLVEELPQRATETANDLISEAQLIEKLGGVHPSTIWRHEKKGRLKPIKVGANKFYRLSEVIALNQITRKRK